MTRPFDLLAKEADSLHKLIKFFALCIVFRRPFSELVGDDSHKFSKASAFGLFPFGCAQVTEVTLPSCVFLIVIERANPKANIRNTNAKRSLFAAFGCGLGRGCHRPRFLFTFAAGFDLQPRRNWRRMKPCGLVVWLCFLRLRLFCLRALRC